MPVRVFIPSPLLSYTRDAREVRGDGATVDEVLAALDRQYPGIRFRMVDEQGRVRPHMRVFRNGRQVFDLGTPVGPDDSLHIVQALSGG